MNGDTEKQEFSAEFDLVEAIEEVTVQIKNQSDLVQKLIREENLKRDKIRAQKKRFWFALPKELKDAQNKLEFLKSRKNTLKEVLFRYDISTRIDEVPWDFITFFDRSITIMPTNTLSLNIPVKESKASFNFIKKMIASRLKPVEIEWNAFTAKIVDQIHFAEVLNYMECKENLSNIFKNEMYEYKNYYNSIPPKLTNLFFPKDKTEYLDFLCDIHSELYKIVPVCEILNDNIEDAFIFTVEREKQVYIIWENINLSRATYVFHTNKKKYDTKLQFLFDYIVSKVNAKRQRLHSKNINLEEFGKFDIINHTDVQLWKNRLLQILE